MRMSPLLATEDTTSQNKLRTTLYVYVYNINVHSV